MRTHSIEARRPTAAAWTPCGRGAEAGRATDEAYPRRACALAGMLNADAASDEGAANDERRDDEPPGRFPPGQPLTGGAATIVCDGRGGYRVAMNGWAGATCGIADCVRRHELSHAADWRGRWPDGCKDKADGDQIPLGGAGYDAFLRRSECTAYGVEEACISPLAAAAARGRTACEVTLRDHLADTRTQRATYC